MLFIIVVFIVVVFIVVFIVVVFIVVFIVVVFIVVVFIVVYYCCCLLYILLCLLLLFMLVNRTRSFIDAAHKEKLMEREAMSAGRVIDQMMEMIQVIKFIIQKILELAKS